MRNIKDIKVVLLQHYINFFDKKFALLADKSASGNAIKIVNISKKKKKRKKKKKAKELHNPTIRNFKKGKVHASFIDKIWGTDLADM